jgi:hypothetical protein
VSITILVLVALLGFGVGYLLRDLLVERPRQRRGGLLDFTGWRPRDGKREPWLKERSRPFLYLVPPAEETRAVVEPGVRSVGGRAFYSAAWLDERKSGE